MVVCWNVDVGLSDNAKRWVMVVVVVANFIDTLLDISGCSADNTRPLVLTAIKENYSV